MSGLRTTCRTGLPRQPSVTKIGLDNYPDSVHGHEFGGLSRVVMVRKTDQRIFSSTKDGEEPKYETITKETYETFRGNRTERKVTSVEKRTPCDFQDSFSSQSRISSPVSKIGSPTSKTSSSNGKIGSPVGKMGMANGKAGSPNGKVGSPVGKTAFSFSTPTKEIKQRPMETTSFAADCLAAHNEYRAKHGVPPLKLNKQICKTSQQWAETLAIRGKLSHSQNREYGENIYSFWTNNPSHILTGREPVESWYKEMESHLFGTEPRSLQSGHFTQVIWKESKELGVAYAKARDGKFLVVANYSPPGNCIGHFNDNVPPIGGFSCRTSALESKSKPLNGILRSSSSEFDLKFEDECLSAHNEYRKEHGVEPLKLNRKMCKESKDWAKHLALKGQIEHRKHGSYGENIYCCWSSNPSATITGKEPVESWYSENSCHDFNREPTDLRSGHFTQVIWKTSRELGVGVEKNRNGQIFVVASYSPAGNYIGSFIDNVLPKFDALGDQKCLKNGCATHEEFDEQALTLHNEYRRKHGVPDLNLNSDMCKHAQCWADNLAREGKLAHRPDCKYGENIFYMWSSDPSATPTAKEVCKKWYDELQDFTFGIESRTPKAGHFTQMIWKESTEFGIAMSKGKNNGKSFVVAYYNPKGNYIGKYLNNVPKPLNK